MLTGVQVEITPWNQQRALIEYCRQRQILVMVHSPFAKGKRFGEPTLTRLSMSLGRSEEQLCIAWLLSQGLCVVPPIGDGTSLEEHASASFALSSEALAEIGALEEALRVSQLSNNQDLEWASIRASASISR